MLRCIRCGACMNHCPVYHGGRRPRLWLGLSRADGRGADAGLVGIEKAGHLPNASTFCGRCEEVCPVRIPLPKLMRHWREREFERHLSPATVRCGLARLGLLREAAAALSRSRRGSRCAALGAARQASRPLPLAAARRRLDAASRLAGAARADLPGAVEAKGAKR